MVQPSEPDREKLHSPPPPDSPSGFTAYRPSALISSWWTSPSSPAQTAADPSEGTSSQRSSLAMAMSSDEDEQTNRPRELTDLPLDSGPNGPLELPWYNALLLTARADLPPMLGGKPKQQPQAKQASDSSSPLRAVSSSAGGRGTSTTALGEDARGIPSPSESRDGGDLSFADVSNHFSESGCAPLQVISPPRLPSSRTTTPPSTAAHMASYRTTTTRTGSFYSAPTSLSQENLTPPTSRSASPPPSPAQVLSKAATVRQHDEENDHLLDESNPRGVPSRDLRDLKHGERYGNGVTTTTMSSSSLGDEVAASKMKGVHLQVPDARTALRRPEPAVREPKKSPKRKSSLFARAIQALQPSSSTAAKAPLAARLVLDSRSDSVTPSPDVHHRSPPGSPGPTASRALSFSSSINGGDRRSITTSEGRRFLPGRGPTSASLPSRRKYVKLHTKNLKKTSQRISGKLFLAQALDTTVPFQPPPPPSSLPVLEDRHPNQHHVRAATEPAPKSPNPGEIPHTPIDPPGATVVPLCESPQKQMSFPSFSLLRRRSSASSSSGPFPPQVASPSHSMRNASISSAGSSSRQRANTGSGGIVNAPSTFKARSGSMMSSTAATASPARGKGKGKALFCLAWSHDGRYLATAGQDTVVRVYRTVGAPSDLTIPAPSTLLSADGLERDNSRRPPGSRGTDVVEERPFREWTGHSDGVLSLSWSKNGFLLSSSMDKTVRLWHPSRAGCMTVFQHPDFVTSVSFHPRDDRFFLSGGCDSKLRIWSIVERKVRSVAEVPETITAVAFGTDGKVGACGTFSGKLFFFDDTLTLLSSMRVRSSRGKNSTGKKITNIQFLNSTTNPADERILVSSNDSRVRLYRMADKALEVKMKGHVNDSSQIGATLDEDGRWIISGSEDGNVYLWGTDWDIRDKQDGTRLQRFEVDSSVVSCAIMAPISTRLLLASANDDIYSRPSLHAYGSLPCHAVVSRNQPTAALTPPSPRLSRMSTRQQEESDSNSLQAVLTRGTLSMPFDSATSEDRPDLANRMASNALSLQLEETYGLEPIIAVATREGFVKIYRVDGRAGAAAGSNATKTANVSTGTTTPLGGRGRAGSVDSMGAYVSRRSSIVRDGGSATVR